MLRLIIAAILLTCLLPGCHKENGKRDYEMQLIFDSGDIFTDTGKIFEKSLKRRKGQEIHANIFNNFTFLKVKDKLVCSYRLWLDSDEPVAFASGLSGSFKGDVYFDGEYTQKGRAYTVEDGYFEFIWRNEVTGAPMNSIVYKGKWTLKRN